MRLSDDAVRGYQWREPEPVEVLLPGWSGFGPLYEVVGFTDFPLAVPHAAVEALLAEQAAVLEGYDAARDVYVYRWKPSRRRGGPTRAGGWTVRGGWVDEIDHGEDAQETCEHDEEPMEGPRWT